MSGLNDQKIFLQVSYQEKDNAKALGARWDNTARSWYVFKTNPNYIQVINTWGGDNSEKITNANKTSSSSSHSSVPLNVSKCRDFIKNNIKNLISSETDKAILKDIMKTLIAFDILCTADDDDDDKYHIINGFDNNDPDELESITLLSGKMTGKCLL